MKDLQWSIRQQCRPGESWEERSVNTAPDGTTVQTSLNDVYLHVDLDVMSHHKKSLIQVWTDELTVRLLKVILLATQPTKFKLKKTASCHVMEDLGLCELPKSNVPALQQWRIKIKRIINPYKLKVKRGRWTAEWEFKWNMFRTWALSCPKHNK